MSPQVTESDLLATLDHHLKHETRHLARLAVIGGIVIDEGDVGGPLQQPVEIIGVYGHLMVGSGQSVGLTDVIGDERCIVDAFGNVTLVT